ncbi:unnamed protein product [Amoebophrya sp. A25]|nr:unnamed protein product [Amoebophrya sp. A25]|eukprot:GSA25T00022260001.1
MLFNFKALLSSLKKQTVFKYEKHTTALRIEKSATDYLCDLFGQFYVKTYEQEDDASNSDYRATRSQQHCKHLLF